MPQISGGGTITSTSQIGDGIIIDADINASAAIAKSKLAALAIVDADVAAHTTSKITVPATLLTVAGQAQGDVIYFNGTNWVRLAPGTSGQFFKTLGAAANPSWGSALGSAKTGVATRAINAASSTQNIAHGLGVIPALTSIICVSKNVNTIEESRSEGWYDGTNIRMVYTFDSATTTNDAYGQSTTTVARNSNVSDGVGQDCTITVDATNINLVWTKQGTPGNSYNMQILWCVFG